MLSPETVETAFRLILGRPPESQAAIAAHQGVRDEAQLRLVLLQSPEFREKYAALAAGSERARADAGPTVAAGQGILRPLARIETEAEGESRARLWSRVAAAWAALGQSAPHWSVLTHDRFRPESFEANRALFVESGAVEGMLVDAALARLGGCDPARMDCIEIGCGVGRATRALAARFAHVTGVDVSPAHLAIAEADFAAEGIANAGFCRISGPGDYAALPQADVFYSRIVLQHNPPPVQTAILRALFARLRPGGVALFQTVTDIAGYTYSVMEDLARADAGMEMHALPQPTVFRLMAEAGLAPVEVQEDFAAGDRERHRSHLFLARKR